MSEQIKQEWVEYGKKYDGMAALDLGKAMRVFRLRLEELSEEEKAINKEMEFLAMKTRLAMDAENLKTISFADNARFKTIKKLEKVIVNAGQKTYDLLFPVLRKHNMGALIKEQVDTGSLKSTLNELRAKEMADENGMPPQAYRDILDAGVTIDIKEVAGF